MPARMDSQRMICVKGLAVDRRTCVILAVSELAPEVGPAAPEVPVQVNASTQRPTKKSKFQRAKVQSAPRSIVKNTQPIVSLHLLSQRRVLKSKNRKTSKWAIQTNNQLNRARKRNWRHLTYLRKKVFYDVAIISYQCQISRIVKENRTRMKLLMVLRRLKTGNGIVK